MPKLNKEKENVSQTNEDATFSLQTTARRGESLIREVLKEISQSRMIKKRQLKIFYYVILAASIFFTLSKYFTYLTFFFI